MTVAALRDKNRAASGATPAPGQRSAASTFASALLRGEVFSINLIRRDTVSLRMRRTLAALALGYVAANLVVLALLLLVSARLHLTGRRLESTLGAPAQSVASQRSVQEGMEVLAQRARTDLERLTAVVALQRQRLPIAGALAALTKTLPPRTWITNLSGSREHRKLTIQAAYLVDREHPYELPIKRWIDTLHADPVFGQGLKRLELTSSSRKSQGRAELCLFDLVAEWAPAPAR